MGNCGINDVDNYANGGSNFFKLEDEGDTATIRFMYNSVEDVQFSVVHEIDVGDKKRVVNCLRSYDESVDNCPLCRAGLKQQVKLYIPVYNEKDGEAQIWQRGKKFAGQLSGLCGRYNPLVSMPIEVERHGRKGDMGTTYTFYPTTADSTTLEDLPDIPQALGTVIMDKTFDELVEYVSTGRFSTETSKPVDRSARNPETDRPVTVARRQPPQRKF